MSTPAYRYGLPQAHEDPVEDAVKAHQAALNTEVGAIRSVADDLVLDGSIAEANQLHDACISIVRAGEHLDHRVRRRPERREGRDVLRLTPQGVARA